MSSGGRGIPRASGFTMIELLVVMAVLGVLAAAVMPLGEALLQAQKERDLRAGRRASVSSISARSPATSGSSITRWSMRVTRIASFDRSTRHRSGPLLAV